jgi:hypothetical protein
MIRNEGGAIATVYPAKDAEATANLFASSPSLVIDREELLDALRGLRNRGEASQCFCGIYDQPDRRHTIQCEAATNAIAKAEGRSTFTPPFGLIDTYPGLTEAIPPEPKPSPEANTKSVFPEELL